MRADRTARPSRLTAADRMRLAAPIRRKRGYTLADALRHAAYLVAAVVILSALWNARPEGDWRAVDLSGRVIESGLTFADCVDRYADCRRRAR